MENGRTIDRSKRKTGRVPRRDGQNAEHLSELLEIIGTAKNEIERENAEAGLIEGREQLVKTTACEVLKIS